MTTPDVTIRGIGLFSALGIGVDETLAALREGESALFPIAVTDEWTPLAGEVPEIDTQRWLGGAAGFLDRTSLLMLAASTQALEHAGLDPKSFAFGRFGVMAGTVWGGVGAASLFFRDAVEKGPRLVKPMLFPHTYGNTAASLIAMRWGLSGPHGCDMTGRIAGGQAFVEAVAALRFCHADAMLVAGGESLSPQRRAAVAASGRLPRGNAEDLPRAFDARLDGCVLGEAGAACVLTRDGVGEATVAGARWGNSVAATIRAALDEAKVKPGELSVVVSSACGCHDVDRLEAVGLREALGEAQPPVVAPLALCGELEGANAIALVAMAMLCHRRGVVFPVLNLLQPHVEGLPYARGDETLSGAAALVVATDVDGACFACVVR